jgi:hypothetical protein
MSNLYDAAKAYTKKDITSLPELNLKTLEIKKDSFGEGKEKKEYFYIEIDGWKYTVKAAVLNAIKEVIEIRPTTTKVKVYKDKDGELKVMPLD